MPDSCLADRLGDLIDLTAGETVALAALEQRDRVLKRGAILFRENDRCAELFVLRRGMMMSYVLLDDGSRQILRFIFPGDIVALSPLVYRTAPETVAALTESVVCPFDRSAIGELAVAHPRVTSLIMVMSQIERVALTDRLAALGRTSAKARIAALLLEIRNGLRLTDRAIGATFALGLTQEEMGDAIGLTAVHVNRMLRQLEQERTITRQNGTMTLIDEDRLTRAANYVDRFAGLDLGWLPAPR